jgi:hypothetical protein
MGKLSYGSGKKHASLSSPKKVFGKSFIYHYLETEGDAEHFF